jgi:hypothetical protein
MVSAVALALSGVVFAGRIAHRLTDAPRARSYGAWAAGIFAGLGVLGIQDYAHYALSFQSDPLIVSLTLGAVDMHLSGRRRWAWSLGVLAGLGRPEVWPLLAAYAVWAWVRLPAMRRLIVAGVIVLLALWFGIPGVTARSPFVAGSNAFGSGRALHDNKVWGTIKRFLDLYPWPVQVLALLSLVYAAVRRDRVTLVLGAITVGWVLVEVAFALHGWPGLDRYMFEAAGAMVVIAAVGIGRLLADPPRLGPVPLWLGALAALAVTIGMVPAAVTHARAEHRDLVAQRKRTAMINELATTIRRLGGAARLRRCGEPLTRLEYQTILAWNLRINVSAIGFKYAPAIRRGDPVILFTPHSFGWTVQALHQRLPQCRSLPG